MSEGIIKLQKVRVGSILRLSQARKKLKVKFEDERPKDLIKDLSKDIDSIGSAIDSRFNFLEAYGASRSYVVENKSKTNNMQDPVRNKIVPLKNECENTSTEKSKTTSCIQTNSSCTNDHSFGLKKKISYLPAVSVATSDNTSETGFRLKKNIMAPYQTSENDMKVVKKGRLISSHLKKNNKTQLIVLKETSEKASPVVIKQTRPLKRISQMAIKIF